MATVGTLVVEMRANAGQFHAELEKTRGNLQNTSRHFNAAEHAAAGFAAKGITAALPALDGFEHKIGSTIGMLTRSTGALRLFGLAGLAVGVALAAVAIGEEIKHWLTYGETISASGKKLDEFRASLLKTFEEQKRLRELTTDLRTQLGLALASDDFEAGMVRVAASFDVMRIRILDATKEGSLQTQLLAKNEELAMLQRRKLREDEDKRQAAEIIKQRDDQIKAWQAETGALMEQFKARLAARQQFEAQLGQGGLGGEPGSAAAGFGAIRDVKQQFQKELRDLAFLERSGQISGADSNFERTAILNQLVRRIDEVRAKFGNFPAVIAEVDKSLEPLHINFVAIGAEMEKARGFIDKFIATDAELATSLDNLNARFAAGLPAALSASSSAVGGLTTEMQTLKAWIDATTQSVNVLNAALAGGGPSPQ